MAVYGDILTMTIVRSIVMIEEKGEKRNEVRFLNYLDYRNSRVELLEYSYASRTDVAPLLLVWACECIGSAMTIFAG